MLKVIKNIIISSVLKNSNVSDVDKIMVFSYLFFQLCWDFDFIGLCSDINSGTYSYNSYAFDNIQNPCPVGDKTDINLEVN